MVAVHTSPFAGSWYPGGRAELEPMIEGLFEASLRRTGADLLAEPLAFVVPHAGLAYSGTVAASAYRNLQAAKPRRVFILGFSHRGGRKAVELPEAGAISTPLGDVQLDVGTMLELAAKRPFSMTREAQLCDHSIEIQLPMLQVAAPEATVVPIYVGRSSGRERREAAAVLAGEFRPGDVFLASSDLTHYGHAFGYEPFPPDGDAEWRLRELDMQAVEAAGSLDADLFLETLGETGATVCGSEPIALLLETLGRLGGEGIFQKTLDYQTSGGMTGDFSHSVSYGSLGYYRTGSFFLDATERDALLTSARKALRLLRETGERQPAPAAAVSPALNRKQAVFVSLHNHGELFGCIGCKEGDLTLAESTPHLALASALDDPRFWPRTGVPGDLEIEISVLTPLKRIRDWSQFRLRRDGAVLDCEGRHGLLLPQVAGGSIDTGEKFLEALSRKIGLAKGAYRDPKCRLSVFRAQVFGDRPE